MDERFGFTKHQLFEYLGAHAEEEVMKAGHLSMKIPMDLNPDEMAQYKSEGMDCDEDDGSAI